MRISDWSSDVCSSDLAVIKDYGSAHGLDPANWTFLTTASDQPEDATRPLAEAYGHSFAKTGDGYQVHGVVTHVVDKPGQCHGNFHGLKVEPANLSIGRSWCREMVCQVVVLWAVAE